MNDNEYWEQEEALTKELVKSLPSSFKESALEQIRAYLELLSPEDKTAWGNYIGGDPILRRMIYYVFSTEKDTEGRFEMILTIGGGNFIRDMEYVYFALEQPEIRKNDALRLFLSQMKDNWLRILIADTIRLEGSKVDIKDLRSKAVVKEGSKVIFHLSRCRMEITRSRIDVYVLDSRTTRKELAHFFTIDDILIRQIQEYQFSELRNETFTDNFKVYVYNRSGTLITPPEGYRNPFEFSLLERYLPMIRKEGTRHSDFVFGDTITSEGIPGEKNKELESIFYETVSTIKSGHPSYIKKAFKGKVNDIYDQRSSVIDGERKPIQEREDSIEDMLSEGSEDHEGHISHPLSKITPTENLPKNPLDLIIECEESREKEDILERIRNDERLVAILDLKAPRSKKDQKYVERKTSELKKSSHQ